MDASSLLLFRMSYSLSAHEYTASNAKFAISVEPKNPDLIKKVEQVRQLRENQTPTIPCLLEDEKKTNPFLRVDFSPEIRKNVFVHNGTFPLLILKKFFSKT